MHPTAVFFDPLDFDELIELVVLDCSPFVGALEHIIHDREQFN
jgi:hypothetical protein